MIRYPHTSDEADAATTAVPPQRIPAKKPSAALRMAVVMHPIKTQRSAPVPRSSTSWEFRAASSWFSIGSGRSRTSQGARRRRPPLFFIGVFAGDVVFGHLVRANSPFVGVSSVFHAFDDLGLEG